jgi:predicted AlkP superfamily pyrophosphatase or phosphodiesterase
MRLLLLFCTLFSGFWANVQAQPGAKKAVFIILDGIPADVMETLNPPNLAAIAGEGGYARAKVGGEKGGYSQTPTISAVGYNSVLTGTWVNKHNVWDNDIKAPNYHYRNIFRLLKEQEPQKTIGLFSSWQDNRTKLVGEGLDAAGNIRFDYRFDGLELDTVNYTHDRERAYMHRIDEKVVDEAAQTIRQQGPDLSWVYLEYTDDMGHMYGDSPQFHKAIGYADEQVGRIWQAIQHRKKQFGEDWLVVVTTDHGRDAKTGKGHGGQSDRERLGWIYTNAKNLNSYFKNNEGAIVDVMPTIARFMNLALPEATARELDGIPLIGKISLSDPGANLSNGKLHLRWKAHEKRGKVKISLATTNQYKTGGSDSFQVVKELPLAAGEGTITLPGGPASFYKLLLQGPHNAVNRWILNDPAKTGAAN